MIEFINILIIIILIIVFILLRIAFFTLLEQKVLSHIQIRLGPWYDTDITNIFDITQPFSDAIKLLCKQNILTLNINKNFFIISPVLSFILSLTIWFRNPNFNSYIILNFRLLFFFFN